MFPSCGCSQLSLIVGMGPRFNRSMLRASSSDSRNASSFVSARRDQGRPDRAEHLPLLALDDGHEGEHVLLPGHRDVRRRAVDDGRTHVVAALARHQAAVRVMPGGDLLHPVLAEGGVDVGRDRAGLSGHRERGEDRVRILGRQRLDGAQPLGQRLGDGLPVARRPDARAVDAAPAAVDEDTVDHQVEVPLPVVGLVVAEQDLAETRSVHLHPGIAGVLLDGGRAAEDQAPRAVVEHGGADVAQAGVERHRLARHPCLEERLRHAPRRPGLLRPGLQHQPDLQRDDRQPEAVHPRRVRRQHHAEHRRRRLVAPHDAVLLAVPSREDVWIEATRQRDQDLVEVVEHVPQLLHVHAAHVLGEAGRGRLLPDELVGRLAAVAQGQLRGREQLGRLLHPREQIGDRHLAQRGAGARRLAQVARDDAGVGLAHLGHRLAGVEVHHLVDVEAPVGLAPPERGEVNHDALSAPAAVPDIRADVARAQASYSPSVTSMLIVAQRPSCVRC